MFDLQEETVDLIAEEIYFVTILSYRGETVNLGGISCGGDPLRIHDYVNAYYLPGT